MHLFNKKWEKDLFFHMDFRCLERYYDQSNQIKYYFSTSINWMIFEDGIKVTFDFPVNDYGVRFHLLHILDYFEQRQVNCPLIRSKDHLKIIYQQLIESKEIILIYQIEYNEDISSYVLKTDYENPKPIQDGFYEREKDMTDEEILNLIELRLAINAKEFDLLVQDNFKREYAESSAKNQEDLFNQYFDLVPKTQNKI